MEPKKDIASKEADQLDRENLNWDWFDKNHLPSPLYKGLSEKIKAI